MRSFSHLIFAAAIFACAHSISLAQDGMISFEDYTLPNGLRVLLHRDASTPIVCIDICYHVGSKDEQRGKTGFAHLFEHLMFDGSQNVKRAEFDRYCERAGGFNNAYTNEDKTNYYMMLPANQLALGLWLESDRLLKLDITDFGLQTQRNVVKEEKRQRVDNQPYGSTDTKFAELGFREHPYSHPVIGYMDDISNASMDDVVQFHETYYRPNNAVLVVAGDIDIDQTRALVERYFADIPMGPDIPRVTAVEPPRQAEARETVKDNVPLPGVFLAYNACSFGDKDYYAMEVYAEILAGGESSRLYKSLVYEQQIASSVAAYLDAREHPGLMVIYAIANPGIDPDKLEKAIEEELEKLRGTPVEEREIQKVKNQVEASHIFSLQTVQAKADRLAHYATFFGKPEMINSQIDLFLAVTPEDVHHVANRYIQTANRVALHYTPIDKQEQ